MILKEKIKTISSIAAEMVSETGVISLTLGSRWKEIVGPLISKNSSPKLMKNGTLRIYVTSSSWIHHLNSLKHDIMRSVKNKTGVELKKVTIMNSVKSGNYNSGIDFYEYNILKTSISEEEVKKVDNVFDKIKDFSIKDRLSKLVKISIERRDFKDMFFKK